MRWAPVAAYSAAIYILSNGAVEAGAFHLFDGEDKALHFLAYFAYAAFASYAVRGRFPSRSRAGAVVFAWAVLYGASDEFHQSFVPTRDASLADLAADAADALAWVAVSSARFRPK